MTIQNRIAKMFEKKNWAVVGATQNVSKFGNKIFRRLQNDGFTVTPINPVYEEVEGVKTFATLKDMPHKPDCVNVVVSPDRAMAALEDAIELGIQYVWFQPGAFDEAVIERAKAAGVEVVYNACVLVELSGR